jgi:hypothetical protein
MIIQWVLKFRSTGIRFKKPFDLQLSVKTKVLSFKAEKLPWVALIPHSADCPNYVACLWIVICNIVLQAYICPTLSKMGNASSKMQHPLLQFHL